VVIKVGEMYGVELELGRVNQKEQDKNKDKGVNALKMFIALMFYKPKKTSVSCQVSRYLSSLFSLLFSSILSLYSILLFFPPSPTCLLGFFISFILIQILQNNTTTN
jgi:hypothetical protein